MQVIQKIISLLDAVKVGPHLRRSRAVQSALFHFGHIPRPKRWIFVIGSYNSGTTLLSSVLAEHPHIAGFPKALEGVVLTDSLLRPEEFGWTRMWCKCLNDIRMDPEQNGSEIADRIKKQWSIWYPKGAQNLLEKSITNATRMLFLQTYFQPAYFIYIVRNGYAVAEGIRRRAKPGHWNNKEYKEAYPIELCAEQWFKTDELVSQDSSQIKNFLKIYYEDLTEDTASVMNKITAFLGLSPISKAVVEKTWNVSKINSTIRNMNWRSFERLSLSDIEMIEKVAGVGLEKHGYKRPVKKA